MKSILLTTLLGNNVNGLSSDNKSDTPTALLKIIESLHRFLDDHPTMQIFENPALPEENFNRHWDQKKYENFRNKIKEYYNCISDAYYDEDHNSSTIKWRKVFGDQFGALNESTPMSVTPRKPFLCDR